MKREDFRARESLEGIEFVSSQPNLSGRRFRDPAGYGQQQTGAGCPVRPFERISVRTPPFGAEGLRCATSLAGRGCSRFEWCTGVSESALALREELRTFNCSFCDSPWRLEFARLGVWRAMLGRSSRKSSG